MRITEINLFYINVKMDAPLNKVWKEKPELIRSYFDKIATFQRLCDEVKYILQHRINSSSIEIGMLSSRAKTLDVDLHRKLTHLVA